VARLVAMSISELLDMISAFESSGGSTLRWSIMGNVRSSQVRHIDWLAKGPLALHVEAFKHYLTDRGYAAKTFGHCMSSIAHFSQWLHCSRLRIQRIDEAVVGEFLDEHLPLQLCRLGSRTITQNPAPKCRR